MKGFVASVMKKSLTPDVDFIKRINYNVGLFVKKLKLEIKKHKIKADVFVGGSFAKGTMLKGDKYDVDVFVRFDSSDKMSEKLEKVFSKISKNTGEVYLKVHGSRDYFQLDMGGFCFEVVPVLKINNPKKAENVTDLSYFHVNYVKKKANKLAGEIRLAKAFFSAIGVYGAESYIQGFSGYGAECLIIHYKSFAKMIKTFVNAKEQIIIDPAKHYRNAQEVLIELNESKRKGPIVLVDPTFKERNVLAALNKESFERTVEMGMKFLKSPNERFFQTIILDIEVLKNRALKFKAELIVLNIGTERQAGDIAGTKMKKFSRFVERYLEKQYSVLTSEFDYTGANEAKAYFIVKPKKEIILRGPPKDMDEHVVAFRKLHKDAVLKRGRWYASAKAGNVKDYLELLINNRKILEQMDISKAELKII